MGNLITVSDLALEGIQGSEGLLENRITAVEALIESYTGYRFYSHSATVTLDGTGVETLLLPQPAISITSITEDGTAVNLTDDVKIYNRRPPHIDDRYRPRVEKINTLASSFGRGGRDELLRYWNPGAQNIVLVGTWGFTDLQGSTEVTPPEIKHAAKRLVALMVGRAGIDAEEAARRARLYAASLGPRDMSITFHDSAFSRGPSGDPETDEILNRYRHPWKGQRSVAAFGAA